MLDRDDERQARRLAGLVTRFGPRFDIDDVRDPGRRKRFQPRGLAVWRPERLERSRRSSLVGQQAADSPPPLERAQAGVRRDPVEPTAKGAATVELIPASPRAEKRVLDGVLRVMDRAQHPVAMEQDLVAMLLGKGVERFAARPVLLDRHGQSVARRVVARQSLAVSGPAARRGGRAPRPGPRRARCGPPTAG